MGRRGLKSHSYKKRKSMFSFGDVILPFVGILAVIMLLFAAKVFFFDSLPSSNNNLYGSSQSVPKISPDVKANILFPAAGEASAQEQEPENENLELNNNAAKIDVTSEPVNNNKQAANKNTSQVNNNSKQAVNNNTRQVNNKQAINNNVKQVNSNNKQAQWRVQVGAYGSKKAANEIIEKLAKAGYTATSFAVSRHHKVWVQAGNTKQEAERTAAKLKKIGYPGSYVIAPPPVKSQK
ncbi:MAG: SPOR domain-containing protein [Synergistaceae bacterium]|nr:SPOR domain-containing protein [Synergistaceae bacterium]